jgi:Tol biopolymer transport system component
MRNFLLALTALTLLAASATASWATAPGKNGRIAFRGYLDAARTTGALFTMNPDGSQVRRVTHPGRGVIDQEEDWSPDGLRFVFDRRSPCPGGGSRDGLDGKCDLLYTVRRDGKGLKRLVPCAFDATAPLPCVGVHTPSWSPDGSRIAFRYSLVDEAYDGALDVKAGIWIVNANGTGRRQVTQLTPGTFWDSEPQWSPDGARLVFVRLDLQTKREAIFTVKLDGSGAFQVTPWELNAATRPDWSPDGRWIVFTAHPADGSENVYKAHPDGSELTNLTKQQASGFHHLSSTFSPDGARIVSARTPGTGPQKAADIVVMNADGTGVRRVTKTRLWESSVDWGPRA